MSLPALALRIATVFALRGATWAGQSVFDEPNDPIASVISGTSPVIAVYSSNEQTAVHGRDILAGDRKSGLIIQIYLPASIIVADGAFQRDIDVMASGGAFAVGLIHRQIEAALLTSTAPWAKLWRDIVFTIDQVESRPYLIETDTRVRVVTREIEFTLDTVASPGFGKAPEGLWSDFMTLVLAEPDIAPLHGILLSAFQTPFGLADWKQAQASLGLTQAGIRGIGIAPVDTTETENPALLDEITIDGLMADDVVIQQVIP